MSDRLTELTRVIADGSTSYGNLASQLSDKIEELEARLRSLQGKVQVEVALEVGLLEFDRGQEHWGLFLDGHPLTSLPIEIKAEAAMGLEQLLDEMIRRRNDLTDHLMRAVSTVSGLLGDSNPRSEDSSTEAEETKSADRVTKPRSAKRITSEEIPNKPARKVKKADSRPGASDSHVQGGK